MKEAKFCPMCGKVLANPQWTACQRPAQCIYELRRRRRREQPCAVYRCFAADGDLLYVGKTQDLDERLGAHRSSISWPEWRSLLQPLVEGRSGQTEVGGQLARIGPASTAQAVDRGRDRGVHSALAPDLRSDSGHDQRVYGRKPD